MKLFISIFLALFLFYSQAFANNISIIRDSEIEDFLQELSLPILKAANLDPRNINIYIVNDNNLNAFVAGGQNIFINTGLITRYKKPDILIGVIAHEAGHISAGHLARGNEEMKKSTNAMILTYLAGITAAIIAKSDAAYAVLMGGTHITERIALKYNRSQEEAADRLAVKYLKEINYSVSGLIKLLQFFKKEESAHKNLIDEYALTHPVSSKRINYLFANLYSDLRTTETNQKLQPKMNMVIAKLESFLVEPDKMLNKIKHEKFYTNNPQLAQYALSITYFKKGQINKSISKINALIKSDKKNSYLWELKGQILSESGKSKQAVIAYKKSIELKNGNNLAKISLASTIISLKSNDKDLLKFAIKLLNSTLPKEKNNPEIFKQLSIAHSQNQDQGRANLALAELSLLQNKKDKARTYAKLAKKHLEKSNNTDLLKANDILEIVKEI